MRFRFHFLPDPLQMLAGFAMRLLTQSISARALISFLLLGVSLAFSCRAAEKTADAKQPVLCWYMVCFGNSVEGYKQEIELAQRHGIDGFLLDVGAWQEGNPLKPTNYVGSAERMYEAAKQLNSGFLLAMAPEYSVQPSAENLRDMVLRFRDHPNQFRHDGKVVLSGYGGGGMYDQAIEKLKGDGVSVFLVPSVFLPRFLYSPSIESWNDAFSATPALDGLMMFSAEELGNVISDNATARRATQKLNKILAAGVIPAYNSANLNDYRGLSGYMAMWKGAIDDGADWISIVIWNDYNEDSGLMPMRWPAGAERQHYDRDESFLEATSYESAWFKSGRQPAIAQDKMFVTYRNRSKWLRKGWDGKKWVDNSLVAGRADQIHDDVEDLVYVDTLLTAPASVDVRLGKSSLHLEMPAGIGHAEVPMVPGVPRLTLERDKKVLADVIGRKLIIEQATEKNSFIGYHLLNRTWTSGTAIGPVVKRVKADAGALENGATIVTEGGVSAVKNEEVKGSGFAVPLDGLRTATYNLRISYSNPSAEEARLTLFCDGPPRAASDYPYFIPAFLPPTEKGKFQTVSFMWSLYDKTTTLKLEWQPGEMFGHADPNDDDHGSVLIEAVEFIKVEPVTMPESRSPTTPELVWIPGGKFEMGSDKGEPDERPAHSVTMSGFAMGKYPITNSEFEQFDPDHRKFRNGNSWRDREPVVHISWVDAAKYCNWLSQKNGLSPAYSEQPANPSNPAEKSWVADGKTDGFRLPTEAQWEYEATGRGEGRTYPWGEDPPEPGIHGRFQGHAALGAHLPRAATEDNGVVVVGSYPAGASRDGLMDLAGNAGQWCEDWYDWYGAAPQTDPSAHNAGHYRVIRGGSWSWYGYRQQGRAREFNSPNYPGHAYYGLRVALPESGWAKIKDRK